MAIDMSHRRRMSESHTQQESEHLEAMAGTRSAANPYRSPADERQRSGRFHLPALLVDLFVGSLLGAGVLLFFGGIPLVVFAATQLSRWWQQAGAEVTIVFTVALCGPLLLGIVSVLLSFMIWRQRRPSQSLPDRESRRCG